MFAEDVDLLPNKMFKRMLEHTLALPDEFQIMASDLFRAMKTGGRIGFEHVAWFNGGLFNDDAALPLDKDDIALTLGAAALDWAEIDPSILGTLFERGLDPGKRSQLGAHYTEWLTMPLNPNGRPNADVLKPTVSGIDLARRPLDRWVIDFGTRSEAEAALYEAVFAYAVASIKPVRAGNREARTAANWWHHRRSGADLKLAIAPLERFLATGLVSKHRIFSWYHRSFLPDTRLVVIARDDDAAFGILSSIFHERWTLRACQYHGVGNDPIYTPGSTFETFPFPEGLTPNLPASTYASDPRAVKIADAAKRLNELREAWLNPSDLVKRMPEVVPGFPDRILAVDDKAAAILKRRMPAWRARRATPGSPPRPSARRRARSIGSA